MGTPATEYRCARCGRTWAETDVTHAVTCGLGPFSDPAPVPDLGCWCERHPGPVHSARCQAFRAQAARRLGLDPEAASAAREEEETMTKNVGLQASYVLAAIERCGGSLDEREALAEIYDVEGFGGREDDLEHQAAPAAAADALVAERLVWLRDQRAEGLRRGR